MRALVFLTSLLIASPAMAEEASWMDIQICKSHQIMEHANDLASKKITDTEFNKMIDDCYKLAGKKANKWRQVDQNATDDYNPNVTIQSPQPNPLRHINPNVDGPLPSPLPR